jgi:hypothetical protein
MMDAEIFGGIGVAIMVFRTEFRVELDRLNKYVDERIDKPLTKLLGSGDLLRKSASSLAELRQISVAINEARHMQRRCSDLLPDFAMHANPHIRDYGSFAVVGKSADAFGNFNDAIEAGAVEPLQTAQKPVVIDLAKNAVDAMLRHRPDLNGGGEQ